MYSSIYSIYPEFHQTSFADPSSKLGPPAKAYKQIALQVLEGRKLEGVQTLDHMGANHRPDHSILVGNWHATMLDH